jgi:hypothetical protein
MIKIYGMLEESFYIDEYPLDCSVEDDVAF